MIGKSHITTRLLVSLIIAVCIPSCKQKPDATLEPKTEELGTPTTEEYPTKQSTIIKL